MVAINKQRVIFNTRQIVTRKGERTVTDFIRVLGDDFKTSKEIAIEEDLKQVSTVVCLNYFVGSYRYRVELATTITDRLKDFRLDEIIDNKFLSRNYSAFSTNVIDKIKRDYRDSIDDTIIRGLNEETVTLKGSPFPSNSYIKLDTDNLFVSLVRVSVSRSGFVSRHIHKLIKSFFEIMGDQFCYDAILKFNCLNDFLTVCDESRNPFILSKGRKAREIFGKKTVDKMVRLGTLDSYFRNDELESEKFYCIFHYILQNKTEHIAKIKNWIHNMKNGYYQVRLSFYFETVLKAITSPSLFNKEFLSLPKKLKGVPEYKRSGWFSGHIAQGNATSKFIRSMRSESSGSVSLSALLTLIQCKDLYSDFEDLLDLFADSKHKDVVSFLVRYADVEYSISLLGNDMADKDLLQRKLS